MSKRKFGGDRLFRRLCFLTAFLAGSLALILPVRADDQSLNFQGTNPAALKQLTLEQLSHIEVTTPSKEGEPPFRTPFAIYVITGEDIRRSGVISMPRSTSPTMSHREPPRSTTGDKMKFPSMRSNGLRFRD
jgi:hypothetical protein